jgi:ribosomal protein S18 acetylase RimI-like enzyme
MREKGTFYLSRKAECPLFETLEVMAENESAVGLYKSIGFKVMEVLYRDSGTGETIPAHEVNTSANCWHR